MENNQLNQVIQDVEYAKKCIHQVSIACRNHVLTEKERASSEGVRFGSAVYGLTKDIETASSCLHLLNAYRNPEEYKEFLEKLRMYADPDEDYSGSICPPSSDED
jgi:alanine racemase